MSWLTVIWSMAASASLTLALMHLAIWIKQRSNLSHLLLSVAAIAVAGIAACELGMMLSQTPEQFGHALRWMQVPLCILIISLVGFVRVYFRSGRVWLGWLACALRVLALIVNFSVWPNLNYRTITGLGHVRMFDGETAYCGDRGVQSMGFPGSAWLDPFRGLRDRCIHRPLEARRAKGAQRALTLGGSLVFFVLIAMCHWTLVVHGVIASPYLISLPFAARWRSWAMSLDQMWCAGRLRGNDRPAKANCAPANNE